MTSTEASWHLRGPDDEYIKRLTYDENEYGVPAVMDGMLVLDIGAHIGTFSRLCAERGAYVMAYEPDPDNYAVFLKNTSHFDSKKVVLNQAAVMAYTGATMLHVCTSASGHSCTAKRDTGVECGVSCTGIEDALKILVLRNRLSDKPTFHKARIAVCKIDAEGAEYEMIESGCDFALVDRLDIEFHGQHLPDAQPRAEKCRERLAALGFVEDRWEAAHSEHGWHRLYRGIRKDENHE